MASRSVVVVEFNHIGRYERRVQRDLKNAIRTSAEGVTGRAKQYVILWDAIITGDLYRSIGPVFKAGGTNAVVEATVPYASYVHDGTEHMRARPFLAQAIADEAPHTQERLGRALRGES